MSERKTGKINVSNIYEKAPALKVCTPTDR
jgi:hypothetical protein